MSFREECVNAAKLIGETAQKPILVFFSGGIDSEVVVRSMMEAGVPFEVLISNISYKDTTSMNSYDIAYALDFVKKYDIKYRIYECDFSNYLKTKYVSDVQKYITPRPGRTVIADIVQTFCKDYLCVMGDGEAALMRSRLNGFPDQEGMLIFDDVNEVAAIHAATDVGESAIFGFFHYTPELLLSWLLHKDIQTLVKYERAFLDISYISIKPFIYHKFWPDMTPRPKYTGYEIIDKYYPIWQKNPNDPSVDQELRIVFSNVAKYNHTLSTIIFHYPDLIKMLSPV
jgi:hypothetical protein